MWGGAYCALAFLLQTCLPISSANPFLWSLTLQLTSRGSIEPTPAAVYPPPPPRLKDYQDAARRCNLNVFWRLAKTLLLDRQAGAVS